MRVKLTEVGWTTAYYRVEVFDAVGRHLDRVWFVERSQAATLLVFAMLVAILLVFAPMSSSSVPTRTPMPLSASPDLVLAVTELLYTKMLLRLA